RRRHTRWVSDWSSDVCSSDLTANTLTKGLAMPSAVGPLTTALLLFIVSDPTPAAPLKKRSPDLPVAGVNVLFNTLNTIEPLPLRSEEHTSELQSLTNLVCRLL